VRRRLQEQLFVLKVFAIPLLTQLTRQRLRRAFVEHPAHSQCETIPAPPAVAAIQVPNRHHCGRDWLVLPYLITVANANKTIPTTSCPIQIFPDSPSSYVRLRLIQSLRASIQAYWVLSWVARGSWRAAWLTLTCAREIHCYFACDLIFYRLKGGKPSFRDVWLAPPQLAWCKTPALQGNHL
jgi:hypothetical protein